MITKVGAGHSRRNERELRARNHADPLDGDLQLTSRDREDVLGAVGPEADGFHNFFVALVHYYLLHTPQGSIHELGGHILRGREERAWAEVAAKYGCTGT